MWCNKFIWLNYKFDYMRVMKPFGWLHLLLYEYKLLKIVMQQNCQFWTFLLEFEKKTPVFDLTFDTPDNPGDIFKIYKWFWNHFIHHLLVWTGAKNTSKTQHFLMCFCCVLHQKTPRFFKWGGYKSYFFISMAKKTFCSIQNSWIGDFVNLRFRFFGVTNRL